MRIARTQLFFRLLLVALDNSKVPPVPLVKDPLEVTYSDQGPLPRHLVMSHHRVTIGVSSVQEAAPSLHSLRPVGSLAPPVTLPKPSSQQPASSALRPPQLSLRMEVCSVT